MKIKIYKKDFQNIIERVEKVRGHFLINHAEIGVALYGKFK